MAHPDDFRAIAYAARAIPGQFGLRPHAVAILSGSWSGSHTGDGTETTTSVALTESGGYPPKVRWLNDEDRAVGNLPDGTVEIGPITPAFSGGGTDIASLNASALSRGHTLHLRITGPQHPSGAIYRVLGVECDRAIHYTIRAAPVGNA